MKKIVLLAFVSVLLLMMTIAYASNVLAWSNGGYSDDPYNPDYGTHDWIAEHALDWLPEEEKRYIVDNLPAYLYGTELPDNGIAPDGIGDTVKHHIYYWSNESLQDDASAVRAYEEYNNTLNFLKLGNLVNASKTAGIMSHYIIDVAVFGHVMGARTDWGTEDHHSDYENYVNQRTSSYDAVFNVYLSFDGELDLISAYDAAKELAYDTTFDVDGNLTCVWMNQHYNWSDLVFKNRCGESLNLAVNYLTDVLHTLYLEAVSVHNIDTGLDYLTIQEAINANETLFGHTILVDAGTYYEHVVVYKSISLIGENRSTTVIDGNGTGNVIDITAHYVNVTGFTIRNGTNGIIKWADYNIISGNIVTDNQNGIHLFATCVCNPASENTIRNNIIKNNSIGIRLKISRDNDIYHNNFINNTQQVKIDTPSLANFWDDGYPSGGNYWSNYTGVDVKNGPNQNETGSDGIGDGAYVIDTNNQDNYPLMYPWGAPSPPPPPSYTLTIYSSPTGTTFTVDDVSCTTPWSGTYSEGSSVSLLMPEIHTVGEARYYWDQWSDGVPSRSRTVTMNTNITLTAHYTGPYYQLTFNFSLGEETYSIATLSNSTVTSFNFSQTLKHISFNVTGPDGTLGFCNLTILNSLVQDLWQGNYTVLVDGKEPITMNNWTDGTYTYIYFTYLHSTHKVEIIPEFPTWTLMLLILIVLTVAIAIYKRRLIKKPIYGLL